MKLMNIKDIEKAKARIDSYINTTPIVTSSLLNSWLGHNVYFKAECLQKIGAFKVRGACNTVAWLIESGQRPQHIVANSSGNHAQAVAYAAAKFGIDATIYMPEYSSQVKIQATQAYGARTVLCKTRDIADEMVKQAAEEKGTYWIHPYNHNHVIAGQGTAAYEAIGELGNVDAVFAPCGGGGLLSGTLISTRSLAPNAKVIGAEPLNANDAARSFRSGTIQRLSAIPYTIADGAMTMFVGDITFQYLKQLYDIYEIEEERIIYWAQWLAHLLKLRIEPTSAVPMEAALRWLRGQKSPKDVLIIITGGNIDSNTSQKIWQKNYLEGIPGLR